MASEASAIEKWTPSAELNVCANSSRNNQLLTERSTTSKHLQRQSLGLRPSRPTFARRLTFSKCVCIIHALFTTLTSLQKQIVYRCKWDIPGFALKTPSAKKLIQETCEEACTQARGTLKKKVLESCFTFKLTNIHDRASDRDEHVSFQEARFQREPYERGRPLNLLAYIRPSGRTHEGLKRRGGGHCQLRAPCTLGCIGKSFQVDNQAVSIS